MKAAAQLQSVFDQPHYQRLIEARGDLIRRIVPELKSRFGLSTALDAGCGIGFFSQVLKECELRITAFDGREENVAEARGRFPGIEFQTGDVQNPSILELGKFDLVLCFGLLYHLESPFLAVRHLHALTRKALLLESMCLPDDKPTMLLREEASLEDQSLTHLAFYPSEACLAKMCIRSGFSHVYRVSPLPGHDDFQDTPEHGRRRTALLACDEDVSLPGLIPIEEPREVTDPWSKTPGPTAKLGYRAQRFLRRPLREKYAVAAQHLRRRFPGVPVPLRLPFGAWLLVGDSTVDHGLLCGSFETAEVRFVERFLRSGMTVLDVGAHHGLYTLLASKRVGHSGRVIAFEPSPRERQRLRLHVRLNFCSNVRIEPFALGSVRSKEDLFLVEGAEDGCNSLRPPALNAETRAVRVDVFPLDEYLAERNIGPVDFVKLDVEGGERDVIGGAIQLLSKPPRPVLLVEVQDIRTQPWGYPAREIVSLLHKLGYEWFQPHTDGRLVEFEKDRDIYDKNLVAVPNERIGEVPLD